MKRLIPLFSTVFIFLACQRDISKTELYFKLPKELKEISGITIAKSKIWAIADSGNKNEIYQLSSTGKITHAIMLTDVENTDWEEITSDAKGDLYIGDFGNNDNLRKDLGIYKIEDKDLTKSTVSSSQKTAFYYPEQTTFPPRKKSLFYDCEAFFEWNGYFYLFTKNRSSHFDGTTFLYKVPNKAGNFPAQFLGEFKTCSDFNNCCITAAALSPDKKKVVLLSHSKLWLFEDFKTDNFFNGKATKLELQHYSQKEAVGFSTNDTLLIADEKTKKIGGNVYQFSLKQLKSKS
ncbi:MAG: hypothetical protein ABI426_04240 [Flavobacterium sp.]